MRHRDESGEGPQAGRIVRIPAPLRDFAGGVAEVPVTGRTVGEVLEELSRRHPRLRRHLFADDGSLRSYVNLYVNEDDIGALRGMDTPLEPGDTLQIVPSIAGGSEAPLDADGLPELEREEVLRYSRHIVMPEVGMEGQRRLKAARVLLVGAGGLGSPAALYLAAAGVGTLGLVDFDDVDATNLQRQILYGTEDVGRPKLAVAAARLGAMNPHVRVLRHDVRLDSENALDILAGYDVVVDGSDNFPTRYLVNDACVLLGLPNVYGSIFRFEGQVSVFWSGHGPCYRCLFREPPPPGLVPSCAEGGVLGVLPGIIGSLQALEAIKLILGGGEPLVGRLLLFDALAMRWRELRLRRNEDCPVCGDEPTQTGLIDYEDFCGVRSGSHAGPAAAIGETFRPDEERDERMSSMEPRPLPVISALELKERLDRGDPITIIDVRDPREWEIGNLGPYGAKLLPLGDMEDWVEDLDPEDEIVVYCRSGSRSAWVVEDLAAAGFERVANLFGGILAWSRDVDPSIPRY